MKCLSLHNFNTLPVKLSVGDESREFRRSFQAMME